MKRTFNYTNRRRIDRKHIQIRLVDSTPEGSTIAVTAELADYQFPITAKAFIEARAESAFARRELEHPFAPFWHDQYLIDEFAITDATQFYFRIVEAESSGRLLGFAEDIRLANPSDLITEHDALLPVWWRDTGQEVWRLEFETSAGPTLYISKALQANFAQFANDPMFVACVVPQAFRRILFFALSEDDAQDVTDPESWFYEWYRWMMSLSELKPLASELEDGIHDDRKEDWINETVYGFSNLTSNRFVNAVSNALKERA